MKLLLPLLFLHLSLFSQVTIESKPQRIIQAGPGAWPFDIARFVIDGDTAYSFSYRNADYQNIVDVKTITLTKAKLKELGEALSKVLTADMSQQVWTGKIILSKEKWTMSAPIVQIYYEQARGRMKQKVAQELIAAIKKECP